MQWTFFKCFYLFLDCLQILLASLLFTIIILFSFRCALLLHFLIAVVRINFYKNILIYLWVLANFHIRSIAHIILISFCSLKKSCHSNRKCILILVLIDTHFLLLWTFIISALTEKKYKKFYISCVSHSNHFSPSKHNIPIATMVTMACVGLFIICLCMWCCNTLFCYIFLKFVKLYAKKVRSSKEFKPLFACSSSSK